MTTDDTAPESRVLFVCTGNVCRSPYLELVTRRATADSHAGVLRVASAGTSALDGHPISEAMARILRARGIVSSAFRARTLTRTMVADADLVVTATHGHVSQVVGMLPRAARRTFTLMQLARLLRTATDLAGPPTAGSAADIAERANFARGFAGAASAEDDIEDPWHRSSEVYERAVGHMDEGLVPLLAHLAMGPATPRRSSY